MQHSTPDRTIIIWNLILDKRSQTKCSECPKSELVPFSDIQFLSHSQMRPKSGRPNFWPWDTKKLDRFINKIIYGPKSPQKPSF